MTDPEVTKAGTKYSLSVLALMIAIAVFSLGSGIITFTVLQQIRSCTVTSGDCYKDSSRRTGGAVQSINKYTVAANLCADKYDGDDVILACIERTLKEGSSATH